MVRFLLFFGTLVLFALPAGAVDLKIATVAPDGSAWMQAMRRGADEVRERTEDRVNFKFYTGGVMGNDKSVLRKIRVGQLQGGAFTAGSLADVYPDLGIYSLPLRFRSLEEVDFVRPRLDQTLIDGLEKAGFVCFGFAEGGFARLMSDTPVRTIEDLHGRKIWVPEGDTVSYRAMESLGLAPVTLPITDVMTGLQAGLVDIVASSPIGAVAFQWHTRIHYVTDTPLSYLFATLAIDRRAFGRLEPADQAVVREVMDAVYARLDAENRRGNAQALLAMAAQGIEFVTPAPGEVARWRTKVEALVDQLGREGAYAPELFERFQKLLAEYRGRHPAPAGSP